MDIDQAMPMVADASGTARGLARAATFVLECLGKLPAPFQVTLGQPVLLQPLIKVDFVVALLHAWEFVTSAVTCGSSLHDAPV